MKTVSMAAKLDLQLSLRKSSLVQAGVLSHALSWVASI